MGSLPALRVVESCLTCKLKEDRLFCNLSGEALEHLNRIKHSVSYPSGAMVFREGQSPSGVLIICQGRVKLTVSSADGKTVILSIAEPGEVLGLSSAISGKQHEATAEVVEPAQLNRISREDFIAFLSKFQDVSLHAAQELSAVHNTACKEIRLLGLAQSVPQKLAVLLLQWDEKNSASRKGRLRVPLTHEEIAQFLGTTRETVSRTISEMKRKGIIEVSGISMVLKDRKALQQLAESSQAH